MESKAPRRTQASRSAATQAALIAAARPLFERRGFADVSADEVARAAGVTRGALYHQFGGLTELFAAVFEQVESEVGAEIAARFDAVLDADPVAALQAGIDAWLDVAAQPEVHRIVLIDAPAVLGWERWREIGRRYAGGLVEGALAALMAAGTIDEQPVLPLTHVVTGALEEAALFAARAEDRAEATAQVRVVLAQLVRGLMRAPTS